LKEGNGICSYLLIGYYSHRLAAIKSAQKAIVVNLFNSLPHAILYINEQYCVLVTGWSTQCLLDTL
jgi:NADH:ubiquinone oxidoreductase subunit 5 (subunit L)/multisubunit Na+/H+ antiporter MnhA subunit